MRITPDAGTVSRPPTDWVHKEQSCSRVRIPSCGDVGDPYLNLSGPTLGASQPPTQLRDGQLRVQRSPIHCGAVFAPPAISDDGMRCWVEVPDSVWVGHGRLRMLDKFTVSARRVRFKGLAGEVGSRVGESGDTDGPVPVAPRLTGYSGGWSDGSSALAGDRSRVCATGQGECG